MQSELFSHSLKHSHSPTVTHSDFSLPHNLPTPKRMALINHYSLLFLFPPPPPPFPPYASFVNHKKVLYEYKICARIPLPAGCEPPIPTDVSVVGEPRLYHVVEDLFGPWLTQIDEMQDWRRLSLLSCWSTGSARQTEGKAGRGRDRGREKTSSQGWMDGTNTGMQVSWHLTHNFYLGPRSLTFFAPCLFVWHRLSLDLPAGDIKQLSEVITIYIFSKDAYPSFMWAALIYIRHKYCQNTSISMHA